mmetsp:Transcript_17783/g.55723  ORF Transcript_17783/g.55723 Transcript_17783/m.55723 type:complete len:248 (-) Transcript_17783:940-1683(-)
MICDRKSGSPTPSSATSTRCAPTSSTTTRTSAAPSSALRTRIGTISTNRSRVSRELWRTPSRFASSARSAADSTKRWPRSTPCTAGPQSGPSNFHCIPQGTSRRSSRRRAPRHTKSEFDVPTKDPTAASSPSAARATRSPRRDSSGTWRLNLWPSATSSPPATRYKTTSSPSRPHTPSSGPPPSEKAPSSPPPDRLFLCMYESHSMIKTYCTTLRRRGEGRGDQEREDERGVGVDLDGPGLELDLPP